MTLEIVVVVVKVVVVVAVVVVFQAVLPHIDIVFSSVIAFVMVSRGKFFMGRERRVGGGKE